MNSLHSLLATVLAASVGEKILLYDAYGEWKIVCECTGTVAFESCFLFVFWQTQQCCLLSPQFGSSSGRGGGRERADWRLVYNRITVNILEANCCTSSLQSHHHHREPYVWRRVACGDTVVVCF